jgi:DNA-binding beta-propeller fold protein YncE
MHGVAFDPATGMVFTGNGTMKSVSEIDPASLKVVRTVDVGVAVDAIAYDAKLGRIYADEDDGTKIAVVDAKTFKHIADIPLPGHKPEYLAVDPATRDLYQNIDDLSEVAVIDPTTMNVARTFPTPEIKANHPLQFDAAYQQLDVGGGGMLSVYAPNGTKKFSVAMPTHIDQCDLDQSTHMLACGGNGGITLIQTSRDKAPVVVASLTVDPGVHTLAFDPKTHNIWVVWNDEATGKAAVQRFSYKP